MAARAGRLMSARPRTGSGPVGRIVNGRRTNRRRRSDSLRVVDAPATSRTDFLDVDGVDLFHRVDGAGAPVLLIGGAVDDADTFAPLASALSDEFAVITYDRRGIGRSVPREAAPGPDEDDRLSRHAGDAAALIAHLDAGPAHVVGVSIGAVVALRLAVGFPSAVASLVVHEPPLPSLVSDPEREVALDRVAQIAADAGGLAAGQEMGRVTAGGDPREDGLSAIPPAGDIAASLDRFFAGDFVAVRRNQPDLSPLVGRASTLASGGVASRGRWDRRCAEAVADRLGVAFHEVPGGHNPLAGQPTASASFLRSVLSG